MRFMGSMEIHGLLTADPSQKNIILRKPYYNHLRTQTSLQEPTMKYLIYVFYLEILINFASGGQSLFMPAAFLGQFSSEPAPAFALEMTRWYGVLIAVLTYLLIRGLMLRGMALKLALEALLFGDVIQIIVSFVTAGVIGWKSNVILSLVISILFAVVRLICLWKPVETGIEI